MVRSTSSTRSGRESLLDCPLQYLAQLPAESASLVEGQEMGAASGLILDESIIVEGHH